MEGRHQRELLAMGLPWKAANMEGCSRAQLLAVSVLASGLAAFLAVLHSLRTSPRPGAAFPPMPSGHAIDSYRGTSMAALSSMTARAAMMTVAPSCGIDDAIAFLFAMQANPSPSPSPSPSPTSNPNLSASCLSCRSACRGMRRTTSTTPRRRRRSQHDEGNLLARS